MSVPARRVAQPAPRVRVPRPRRPLLVVGTGMFVALLLGFVSLSVLLAQDALRAADLEVRIERLIAQRNDLLGEHARLTSPQHIADWAARNGLVMPTEVTFGDPSVVPASVGSTDGGASDR